MSAGVGAAERSRNVDVLRAFAALAVLLSHSYLFSGTSIPFDDRSPIKLLVNQGTLAIWLFFALSGYLISGPFIRSLMQGTIPPSIASYSIRRVGRIYPAYLLAFLFVSLFGLEVGVHPSWWEYLLHTTLLQNAVPGQEQAVFFTSWTLSLEILFYVTVPVLTVVIRRIHPRAISTRTMASAIVVLWCASIFWTYAADHVANPEYGLWLRFFLPGMISMFCPGMLVAVCVASWRATGEPPAAFRWLGSHWIWALVVALPFAVAGALASTSGNLIVYDLNRQFYAVASGIVVVVAIALPEGAGVVGRVLARLGLVSYGIYLWQAVVIAIIDRHGATSWVPLAHTGSLAYLVHMAYLLAIVLPIAFFSWYVVEAPINRWSKKVAGGILQPTTLPVIVPIVVAGAIPP